MFWWLVCVILLARARTSYSDSNLIIRMCPKSFHPVGKHCYHISKTDVRWHEAYDYCRALRSNFTNLRTLKEEKVLADYLNRKNKIGKSNEKWIDGIYNHRQSKWHWGASGDTIDNSFASYNVGAQFEFQCIALDKTGLWLPRNCMEKKRVICRTNSMGYIESTVTNTKRKMKIERCTSGVQLKKYERRKCALMLGIVGSDGPGLYAAMPKSAKSTKRQNKWICPSNLVSLGNKCYRFSNTKKTFQDAYYDCRRNKTSLAVIRNLRQDQNLRLFLNNFIRKEERWIDGMYDPNSKQWKSMRSGQPLRYNGFAKEVNNTSDNLAWHSIFMDPKYYNQWNIGSQLDEKYYICQAKARTLKVLEHKQREPPAATIVITK